jgi:ABC-type antimicrobial peptide transport system permease subunit
VRRLNSLALRNLWSRKLRTLVTGFGIVLGVATVLAFGITNATVENSLNAFFSQTAGDADLTIASSDRGQTFRARVLRQAGEFPGVTLAVGSLWRSGTVRLADKDKDIVLVGIDPAADPQVRRYKLAGGRMMDAADRIYTLVLVKTFADDNDIHLGDDLEIDLGDRRVETFQVTGLLENEGAARSNNGAIGFLRLDSAQTLFDEQGRLSQVDVVVSPSIASDGAALDRFKEDLGAALGDDYTVAYPAAVGQAVNDSMASLRSALGIFSTIALFVGAMLIYNTFTMTVAERTAEIGMLRAVGATRWQILRLVLIEATLMGFLGSVPGLGLGAFLAIPMLQIFAQGLGTIPLDRFTVPPGSVVQAILVGTIVTLVAALIPAWQAGRISPVEAMRARAGRRPGFFARNGWKFGVVLLAFSFGDTVLNLLLAPVLWLAPGLEKGNLAAFRAALSAALLVVGLATMAPRFWSTLLRLVGERTPRIRTLRIFHGRTFDFLAAGGWLIGLVLVTQGVANLTSIWSYLPDASFFILMFTGGTLVVPVTIQLLESVARRVLALVYGPPGGLGSRNLNRARGRTSLTVGVLMVGATMTIAIGSIQVAFEEATNRWVNNALGGDLTVTSDRQQPVEFANQLMGVSGVELATPFNVIEVGVTGGTHAGVYSSKEDTIAFEAVDVPTYRRVAGFQFAQEAEREDEMLARLVQGDAVLISTVLSDQYHLRRGDAIRLRTRRGARDFEIAGVVDSFMWGGKCVVGTWSDMERYLGYSRAWLFLVKLAPGADAGATQRVIEARLGRSDTFEVQSAAVFRASFSRDIMSFMAIFQVVVYIAVLVAGLGVVNTMTMNVLERVREIGMLRSIGMTRGQVGRMVLAEAGAMGVIGGLFGIGIGWLVSKDMVTGMSQGTSWQFNYIFPTLAFVSAAITALVISQLAALYPLWRAGRMRIIEAIQHE